MKTVEELMSFSITKASEALSLMEQDQKLIAEGKPALCGEKINNLLIAASCAAQTIVLIQEGYRIPDGR